MSKPCKKSKKQKKQKKSAKKPVELLLPQLLDYPAPFVEGLCTHTVLRNLGFSADDIYFMPDSINPRTCRHEPAIVLKTQGKEVVVTLGVAHGTPEELAAGWQAFATRARNGDFAANFNSIFAQSFAATNITELIGVLREKGILFPR